MNLLKTTTLAILFSTSSSFAAYGIVASSATPEDGNTAGSTFFSDTGSDYFGVVESGGASIEGLAFTPGSTNPSDGSLTGRDLDDGNIRLPTQTAEWTLDISDYAAIGPFTNISFAFDIAARTLQWDNFGGNLDFIQFELLVDSTLQDSIIFRPDVAIGLTQGTLAVDSNADGVGDGTALAPLTANSFSLSTATTGNTDVVVRVTVRSDSGNEEFWTDGNLTADLDIVPEPSSTAFLVLAGGLLLSRRKR